MAVELFDDALRVASYELRANRRPGRPKPPEAGRLATRNSQLQAISLPATSSSYVFLGAFTPEDELVGYACYGPTPGTDRTYDLYWIAVHPSAQGTGSGTTLLSEVERRLRDTNARLLVVETSSRPDYSATLAFYRARGYTEAARVEDFYAPADSRVILTKRFRESSLPDITGGELSHHE